MISKLVDNLRGVLALSGYGLNTLFWTGPLFLVAPLKAAVPFRTWKRICNRLADGIASNWIFVNKINMRLTSRTQWDVQGLEGLKRDHWYLVMANHQTWVDILVLQKIFHREIPFLKFFLKKELFWFPIMGQAWWALDMPFMKRFSKAKLNKKPHLKGRDLAITQKACEKFRSIPVSVMNFVEGTRFSREKHRRQNSPYVNLLKPNAGGIALALATMGRRMDRILNVTISYPDGVKGFWGFLCGQVRRIRVRVESLDVGPELLGDYYKDKEYREWFQEWLNTLWADKDNCLECLAGRPDLSSKRTGLSGTAG